MLFQCTLDVFVFAFGGLSRVLSPWVLSLEGFKVIVCERVLDGMQTAVHERCNFSLG